MLRTRAGKLSHQHAAQLATPIEVLGLILGDGAVIVAHAVRVGCVVQLVECRLVLLLLLAMHRLQLAIRAAHV